MRNFLFQLFQTFHFEKKNWIAFSWKQKQHPTGVVTLYNLGIVYFEVLTSWLCSRVATNLFLVNHNIFFSW